MSDPVEKVKKTCPQCGHRFEHRPYQRRVACPQCHTVVGRDGDRHTGAGIFVRFSEAEKDRLEHLSFDQRRSQADLLREAIALLFKQYPKK